MIAYIKGTVKEVHGGFLILLNNGVGYRVWVTEQILRRAKKEAELEIYTHQHIREDAVELYGFLDFEELLLFEMIIGVSGVGPKLGLGVLALSSVPKLQAAIAKGDASGLTKVSGIGKKTAERIVVDLKEKLGGTGVSVKMTEEDIDAVDVLTRLGYSQQEAREALRHVPDSVSGAEARVKAALAALGKGA